MSLSEIHGMPLPQSLLLLSKDFSLMKKIDLKKRPPRNDIEQYLQKGGLPGVFFVRDKSLRIQKIATQLETILDRDLRLIQDTTLTHPTLKNVLTYIAQHQGESLNLSAMKRATRVTTPTLQKLLLAFEGLFLIRSVATEGGTGGRVYFLEDQAEASYLIGARTEPLYDLVRFLYANLRLQVIYRPGLNGTLFRYETRGGALVPLCFRIGSKEIGVLPILEKNPNRSAISSGMSFLKKYPHGKVVFTNQHHEMRQISPRLCVVPATALVMA